MPSNHIQRINDDIRRTLASLLREVKDPRVQQGDLLSIVRTETTGDLRYCTVYLSVLGDVNEKELKKGLKSCSGWLRHELGTSLSLRYTPELIFTSTTSSVIWTTLRPETGKTGNHGTSGMRRVSSRARQLSSGDASEAGRGHSRKRLCAVPRTAPFGKNGASL